jgi:hypothetical protein
MKIANHDGLWVDEDAGACVGYLFDFREKGVFSPDGKVEITPQQAEIHNKLLSEAEVKGLDENCQVGQRGTFYLTKKGSAQVVSTFIGEIVATDIFINGKSITFKRKGKVFRGRLQKDADCFNFKRIR